MQNRRLVRGFNWKLWKWKPTFKITFEIRIALKYILALKLQNIFNLNFTRTHTHTICESVCVCVYVWVCEAERSIYNFVRYIILTIILPCKLIMTNIKLNNITKCFYQTIKKYKFIKFYLYLFIKFIFTLNSWIKLAPMLKRTSQ